MYMGLCYLCEKKYTESYFSYFCTECRRVKHLLNLYEEDVYNTLECVLVRDKKQQTHKIKTMDNKSMEKVKTRSQTKQIVDEVD
jgi:hypothetical protein